MDPLCNRVKNRSADFVFTRSSAINVNRTTSREFPRMFVAAHWYTPESFSVIFFNFNFPPKTADRAGRVTFECLSSLLHTTAGSELPLAEH